VNDDTITLVFSTSLKGSAKIRFLTRSHFSHCDVDVGYGLLGASNSPDAIVLEGNKSGNGVCTRPYNYQPFGRKHEAVIKTPLGPYIIDKLKSQLGKPFDSDAMYAIFLPWFRERVWYDPSSWYCMELIVWAFDGEHGPNKQRFFPYELAIERNIVTPEDGILIFNPFMDVRRFRVNLV